MNEFENENEFKPKANDVNEWFEKINVLIFRKRLYATFGRIEIRRRRGVWAEYSGWLDYRRNAANKCKILKKEISAYKNRPNVLGRQGTICGLLSLTNKFPNKRLFIEVLAHEMVHLHQFLHASPAFSYRSVSHGKTFHAWRDTFEKYGLKLRVAHRHNDQKPKKKETNGRKK